MEIVATWDKVFRVWWALVWRWLLCWLTAIIIVAMLGSKVIPALGLSQTTERWLDAIIVIPICIFITVLPVKMVINKKYGHFRLSLTEDKLPFISAQHGAQPDAGTDRKLTP